MTGVGTTRAATCGGIPSYAVVVVVQSLRAVGPPSGAGSEDPAPLDGAGACVRPMRCGPWGQRPFDPRREAATTTTPPMTMITTPAPMTSDQGAVESGRLTPNRAWACTLVDPSAFMMTTS